MSSNFFVVSFVVVFLLAGCATSDNPREGGLFGGIAGIHSGAYDNRIQQREHELGQVQHINQGLHQESATLQDEAKLQTGELIAEQQRMAEMEQELAGLQADLNRLKARSGQKANEITALQQSIENTRRQLKDEQITLNQLSLNGEEAENSDRYRLLQKERDRLADEYKALTEYSRALLSTTQ